MGRGSESSLSGLRRRSNENASLCAIRNSHAEKRAGSSEFPAGSEYSFQEGFLAEVECILAIRHQPQQIVEDTLLPPGHEKVIGLDVSLPRFGDQVAIFNPRERSTLFAPFVKTPPARKKSDGDADRVTLNYEHSGPDMVWGMTGWLGYH